VQLGDDAAQSGDAGLEGGGGLVVVALDQDHVHVLGHAEAAVGRGVNPQGAAGQIQLAVGLGVGVEVVLIVQDGVLVSHSGGDLVVIGHIVLIQGQHVGAVHSVSS